MKSVRAVETVELVIESLGFEGKSIAHLDDLVYFVAGGIPGDRVIARVLKRKKRYVEAVLETVLEPSPVRVDPKCRYFGDCGGCKWQHLAYGEQLQWKRQHVIDSFQRIGQVEVGIIQETLACLDPYWYRNKLEFSFGDSRWLTRAEIDSGVPLVRDFALGFHAPGRFDKVLQVEECWLQSPLSNRILNAVRDAAYQFCTPVYQTRTHQGFLRNLVVRQSRQETMIILVTAPVETPTDQALIAWLQTELPQICPEISTTIHAVTTSKAQVAGGIPQTLTGSGVITETLLGLQYRISPFSFFQTNTAQAERLISVALDYAQIQPHHVVWDLYCGTGSLSLPAARLAQQVVGLEVVESSVLDARSNAALNGIPNATFHRQDLHVAQVAPLLQQLPAPDVILVDPPRAGIEAKALQCLLDIKAPRLVYVSCNPATQARDCGSLSSHYRVERIQPVDMFPHTYHVETVAELVRI